MGIPIFKIFAIFGIVSGWAELALADGKVTLMEAVELVAKLAAILGIRTELEIPEAIAMPIPEQDEAEQPGGGHVEPGRERPPPKPE